MISTAGERCAQTYYAPMRFAIILVRASAALFVVVGLGYLIVPGTMLSIVGIQSSANAVFLLRTEGVLLLGSAGLAWSAGTSPPGPARLVLVSLGAYYVLSSLALDPAYRSRRTLSTAVRRRLMRSTR